MLFGVRYPTSVTQTTDCVCDTDGGGSVVPGILNAAHKLLTERLRIPIPTIHQVLQFVIESPQLFNGINTVNLLLETIGSLFTCLGSFLRNQVAVAMGWPLIRGANGAACCALDIHSLLETLKQDRDATMATLTVAKHPSDIPKDIVSGIGNRIAAAIRWPSDPRLKKNINACSIRFIFGTSDMNRATGWFAPGIRWYQFDWNARAKQLLGLEGPAEGILSTEVRRVLPAAVNHGTADGYDRIDWAVLLRYRKQHTSNRMRTSCPRSKMVITAGV